MRTRYILLVLAALSLVSCAKEGPVKSASSEGAIKLASYRQQVFTKADVAEFDFDQGTKYTLFAVASAADPGDYGWVSEKAFENQPQPGEETADHAITYGEVTVFEAGEALDFYGLTFGVPGVDAPVLDAAVADGVDPLITVAAENDRLPDLMHSNSAKNRTNADGVVVMPFEHAVAAVNFQLSKQDESGDSIEKRQLENVKVTEIRLDNVAGQATMDVVTGGWTWSAANVGSRTVYSGAAVAATTTAAYIGDSDILVFPNDDGDDTNNQYDASAPYKYYRASADESANKGEQIVVSVKIEGLEEFDPVAMAYKPMNKTLESGVVVTDGACEITSPLRTFNESTGADEGPLHLLRNHKYVLSVLIMRDNVRIVAVSPQVYEWVDVALTDSDPRVATLGQPITFGETVWMDRNLGAISADCENDWLNTIGYYWEFARNIPFMVDAEVFVNEGYHVPDTRADGASNLNNGFVCGPDNKIVSATMSTADPLVGGFPNKFLYTYDKNGQRFSQVNRRTLTGIRALPGNAGKPDRELVAIDPGDNGTYAFLHHLSGSPSYWYYDGAHTFTTNYWKSIQNQPVPKGWRLPNAKDVYSIMPEETFNWTSTSARFTKVGVPTPKTTTGTALEYAGSYKYQFIYGNIKVNPNADPNAAMSTPLRGPVNETRLYGIKHQGTSKAYRYMIEMRHGQPQGAFTKTYYARFYIYPTSPSDLFNANNTQWNLHKFDWDHPSAYMDFPMSGQMYSSNAYGWYLNLFGIELKIRLDLPSNNETKCMKLSNDGTGVYGTYISTTVPTRLVRDFSAD